MDWGKAEEMMSSIEEAYEDVPLISKAYIWPKLQKLGARLRCDNERTEELFTAIELEFNAL
jgi:hypothetical protein